MTILDHYTEILNNWKRECGPKPTSSELAAVHALGQCRVGALDTFAVAMCLRAKGATQYQIKLALGDVHRNKVAELVANGTCIRVPMARVDGHTCYKIEIVVQKEAKHSHAATDQHVS